MTTAAEQLVSFYDLEGEPVGFSPKYSRRLPAPAEQAVRVAAAMGFLQRMEIGKEVVMPRSQAMTIKASARYCEGLGVKIRKVNEASAVLVRTK